MQKETGDTLKKGFAGMLAERFINSRLTPIIAIVSILLGIFAVVLTPKEEEPQISVPMIDIQTPAPGYEADEVERKITEPIERGVWGLKGVKYIYSASSPHGSLVTVRFKVGEPMGPSVLKVHHKIREIQKQIPSSIKTPNIHTYSIDDVPFLTLTFSSKERDDFSLRELIAPLARKLSSTPDLSRVEMLGGRKRAIRVIVDPARTHAHGISLLEIAKSLRENDASAPSGKNWDPKKVYNVEVGGRLKTVTDVKNIPIGLRAGRIIRLSDIARVIEGPEERTKMSVLFDKKLDSSARNAVSIVFAKRKGTNVVTLSGDLLKRAKTFSANLPDDVSMSIMRNYGDSANAKSKELIEHLLIATLSVALLIAIFMGIRASLVVSIAIPVTLALTLAIYYFMGYTLNRVTLFALIFSIGILVDDAIVVVENVERHIRINPGMGLTKATIRAVSEVGNPTILATFTVIAAILPMAFVRGLMGPYMKPIPVGASFAMILSLFVAFIVTPWASTRLLKQKEHKDSSRNGDEEENADYGWLDRLYVNFTSKLIKSRKEALAFGGITIILLVLAMSLFYFKVVKVKMLPFDNKNEFQILLDYPTTTPLSKGIDWSRELAQKLLENKNVERVQIFSGEPAPYSFSGMVKHTFYRNNDYMNDLQVVLKDKSDRSLSSHLIIQDLRPVIAAFADRKDAVSKVLEIPPGPPVMSTMVAEVYGPTRESRKKAAMDVYNVFKNEPGVVDLDYSWRKSRPRLVYNYDQIKGGLYGTSAKQALMAGHLIFSDVPLVTLSTIRTPEEINVDLSLKNSARSGPHPFSGITIPTLESGFTSLSSILKNPVIKENETRHRKNLKPVRYVMSEMSGELEAPVYGIMDMAPKIKYPLQTAEVPWNTTSPVVKWDGEWFITYEVFRDLGGAFAVVLILIYILVVGWFRSYLIPLVIMTPIPISLIGIIPGHAIMSSYFTATSMIGFIAGAGIIVRNSIILVDFIELKLKEGIPLKDAVINAGLIRFRPMLLTAAAVIVGSFVMLFDPIFQGLAISLMFGEIAATILSRFAVPMLYYWFVGKRRMMQLTAEI